MKAVSLQAPSTKQERSTTVICTSTTENINGNESVHTYVTCRLELRSPQGFRQATHGEPRTIQSQVQPSQGEEYTYRHTACPRTYRGFEDEEGIVPAKNGNY
jgi:hypothetical protein